MTNELYVAAAVLFWIFIGTPILNALTPRAPWQPTEAEQDADWDRHIAAAKRRQQQG